MHAYHLSNRPPKQPKPIVPTRRRNIRPILLLVLVAFTVVGIKFLQVGETRTAAPIDSAQTRNAVIAESLQTHKVNTLVGDFWRVLLVKNQVSTNKLTTTSLHDCFTAQPQAQGVVSPSAYTRHSFAYLASSDLVRSGLQGCKSEVVIERYGQPTAITIIAGTVDKPLEQILFYDKGARQPEEAKKTTINDEFQASSANGLRPVEPTKLVNRSCPGHRTILQIVAHEDDDLLFMNPDLLHAMQQSDCVRTVYMTAGDAGSSKFYWLGRERGSEAAYSLLSGASNEWAGQTVKLGARKFMTAVSPVKSGQLSLLFMHLPDGRPDGQGFAVSNYESLGKLQSGEKASIESVDNQSLYSRGDLLRALQRLMDVYQPDEVRTMRPFGDDPNVSDHSDHVTVGQLTSIAFNKYKEQRPESTLSYYTGYPILAYDANVEGEDLASKEAAFFTYARYDGAVCGSVEACLASGNYGLYLQRQYRSEP